MTRANALRTLARSDPAAYLQAALDTGVIEPAGYLRGETPDVQWWPDAWPGRVEVWRAGAALAQPFEIPETRRTGSDCITAKVQYASKAAAREHRDRLRGEGDASARAYRCVSCGCWHVGHPSRREKKEAMG